MTPTTVGELLKCKTKGVFKNTENEFCMVLSFYVSNKRRFQIIFSKDYSEIAVKPAITTSSESKVLKTISAGGFELQEG